MRYWQMGVFLALAISSMSVGQSAPEPLLLERARQAASGDKDLYNPCLWLSSQEAVISVYHPQENYLGFQRLNIQTGTRTPLAALNTKYRKSLHHLQDFGVSPDGKWLFWSMDVEKLDAPKATTYFATTLDGMQQRRWKGQPDEGVPLWFPDHRRWFTTMEANAGELTVEAITIRDLQKPGMERDVPLKETNPEQAAIGITSQERLLLAGMRVQPTSTVQMADYGLNANAAAPRHYTIQLPMKAKIQEMELSPGGDRLAWLLREDGASAPSAEYQFSPLSTAKPLRYSLWVSDVNGGSMAQIGAAPAMPEAQANENIDHIQWLPDGKKLSFVYKKALYTVAAP